MRPLALEHLTVAGVDAPELIAIAAETGCQTVSVIMATGKFDLGIRPLAEHPDLIRETAARIAGTGVTITNIDGFALTDDSDLAGFRKPLEVGASLGAKNAVTLFFDADEARVFDRFCRLCEMARACGLNVVLEFTPLSHVHGLDDAVRMLARAQQPNARILVDSMHLFRSHTEALLDQVDPALIAYAQICDGPREATEERPYWYEAMNERGIPGEGEFDLVDFMKRLPPGVVAGAEVPLKSLRDQGLSHLDRARRVMDGTRRVRTLAES